MEVGNHVQDQTHSTLAETEIQPQDGEQPASKETCEANRADIHSWVAANL